MAVLDWLQSMLGGGDPEAGGLAAASTATFPTRLRTGGALGEAGQPAGWSYPDYALQHLQDVISGKVAYEGALGPGYKEDPDNPLGRVMDIALGFSGGGLATKQPKVARSLDTNKPPRNPEDWRGFLRGAGWWEPERGVITGTHVTDDPSVVTRALQSGGPITNRGPDKYGDLGPGLYFSDSPQVWGSRSRSKWDFLSELTREQKEALAGTLRQEVQALPKGYVTSSEADRALRDIDYFASGRAPPEVLLNIADQPYNIGFSDPKYLSGLGIRPSKQPVEVPIEVGGRFAQLERNVYGNEADILRDRGYQGAYTQGGFSTTPQFVVWDRDAIKSFNRAPVALRGLLGLPE